VRLTVAGNELETLGQELRTRPFVYRDVPQLDLDSLVMYTSNLNMNVRERDLYYTPLYIHEGAHAYTREQWNP